jgi:hypothetical protein
MILQLLHSHTFQHDSAIFAEYVPGLKPYIMTYKTFKMGCSISTCLYSWICSYELSYLWHAHSERFFLLLLLYMINWNVRVVRLSWHIMEHNISHILIPASFSCGAIHLHKWDCGLQIMEFLYFLWWKPFLCSCCIRNAGLWYEWKLYLRK